MDVIDSVRYTKSVLSNSRVFRLYMRHHTTEIMNRNIIYFDRQFIEKLNSFLFVVLSRIQVRLDVAYWIDFL